PTTIRQYLAGVARPSHNFHLCAVDVGGPVYGELLHVPDNFIRACRAKYRYEDIEPPGCFHACVGGADLEVAGGEALDDALTRNGGYLRIRGRPGRDSRREIPDRSVRVCRPRLDLSLTVDEHLVAPAAQPDFGQGGCAGRGGLRARSGRRRTRARCRQQARNQDQQDWAHGSPRFGSQNCLPPGRQLSRRSNSGTSMMRSAGLEPIENLLGPKALPMFSE